MQNLRVQNKDLHMHWSIALFVLSSERIYEVLHILKNTFHSNEHQPQLMIFCSH